jgi:hypothetical protein
MQCCTIQTKRLHTWHHVFKEGPDIAFAFEPLSHVHVCFLSFLLKYEYDVVLKADNEVLEEHAVSIIRVEVCRCGNWPSYICRLQGRWSLGPRQG